MLYRRITKLLNKKGIKTHTGKEWGKSGNSVYSILKKYIQRMKRIEIQNTEYQPEWSKMIVKWEKLENVQEKELFEMGNDKITENRF